MIEVTKDWHGKWQEITLTPRGTQHKDVETFEAAAKERITSLVQERFRKHGQLLIIGELEAEMTRNDRKGGFPHLFSTGSKKGGSGKPILKYEDIPAAVSSLFATLSNRIQEYEGRGSGWTVNLVNFFKLKLTNYKPFSARKWIDLPLWLRNKKSVVNIKNMDDKCFLYAVVLGKNSHLITNHRDRVKNYEAYLDTVNVEGIHWPFSADQLPHFETLNSFGVNIYALDLDAATSSDDIYPEYVSSKATKINILRVYSAAGSHFCWVSNLDGLVNGIVCEDCLQTFSDRAVMQQHKDKGKCTETSAEALIELPKPEEAIVRFKDIAKQLRIPFAVYLSMDLEEIAGEFMAKRVSIKTVSDYPDLFNVQSKQWEGPLCIKEFLQWLEQRDKYAQRLFKNNVPMKLSAEEETAFQTATQCYLCLSKLPPWIPHAEPITRHRDHDHLNGTFRGALCPGCNVNYNHKNTYLPVLCHGLREREAHLLIRAMDDDSRNLRCLPLSAEKMLCFSWGRCRFLDTRSFIDAELPDLMKTLAPLPQGQDSQVHQLASVFEAFRHKAQTLLGLDPAHFVGVPGLAWSGFLRKTKAKIACFAEGQEDMLEFVQSAVRGGVAIIRKRLATANNPMLPTFDASKEVSWLQYVDCNSLYPSVMVQKLPVGDYAWDTSEWTSERILAWDSQSEKGFFLKVDVHYPAMLHEAHNDLPLLPEKRYFDPSYTMATVAERLEIKPSTADKLVPNLCDKIGLVVHISELKQALQRGLELKKVWKVLEFRQEAFMKPWIELCVAMRREAATELDRDFWKLMMNSVFGKTCEQVHTHADIKFIKTANKDRLEHYTNRPQFKDGHILTDDLLVVELNKCRVKYNKPIGVGASILGMAKAALAEFWYGCIKIKYPKAELCMSDTDSLLFHAVTQDIYKDMEGDERYDTSNYPSTHPLFNPTKAKIPGYFKDETAGRAIEEFVGLRAKQYSLKMADGGSTKKSGGGIKLSVAEQLNHEEYRSALSATSKEGLWVEFDQVQSHQHCLSTKSIKQIGLCPYDDKAWVFPDGIHTLAHGHWKIEKEHT